MIEIPDNEILYRYANPKAFLKSVEFIPTAIFEDEELSCDWEIYQKNPETSIHISQGKTKIIAIKVCDDIRNPKNPKRNSTAVPDWKQEIIHSPEEDNNSHSLIKGKKKRPVTDAIASNSYFYEIK